jgi:hypothetical protein
LARIAGGIWFEDLLNITNWEFTFDVRFTNPSNPPADGICMVFQNDPAIKNTSIGAVGTGIGYGGIKKSLAICIDTYSGTTPNILGTGVFTNGVLPQYPPYLLQMPIADGNWYTFRIAYCIDSGYIIYNVFGNGYSQDFSYYIGDVRNGAGLPGASTATFGVTSSTGGAWANQVMLYFCERDCC